MVLHCLKRAIEDAHSNLQMVFKKTEFWASFKDTALNERQRKVINKLLEEFMGNLTTSKWAKIAKCSQDTAYRDILDLISKGILKKDSPLGRSTSYSLIFLNSELLD